MTEEEFTFHYLETDEDVEQNLELMRKVFGDEGVDALIQKLMSYHPTMTLKDYFVVEHHGKTVASLNLIPLKWSVGGIPLKVAEMGCVATLPEYRQRGLQRRLAEEFHEQAEAHEYDLCAIEGIPYFYRQFGYEYSLPLDETTKIPLEKIPEYAPKLEIRQFALNDVPRAMQLFRQSQQKFYVHSIRDKEIWLMQEKTRIAGGDRFEGYVIEENGEMLAYVRIGERSESKELVLREATCSDERTIECILDFMKRIGKQRELETLFAQTSYYEAITEKLVNLGAVKTIPSYAWQIRIVDYARIFEKVKPLFEERVAKSSYRNLTEKLNFNFYRFAVEVAFEDGIITRVQRLDRTEDRTIRFNPQVFVKLLLGYRSREELEMGYPDVLVRQSHKNLIDTLFPKLPSYIHSAY